MSRARAAKRSGGGSASSNSGGSPQQHSERPPARAEEARLHIAQPQDHDPDELIMDLERDQIVAATSLPVPRAQLGRRTEAAMWALRVFVVLVSLMVLYTFIAQLH